MRICQQYDLLAFMWRTKRLFMCEQTINVNVGRHERSREWAIYDFLSTWVCQESASSPGSRTCLWFLKRRTTSKISWAVVSNASWWTMCQGVHTINRRVVVDFARRVIASCFATLYGPPRRSFSRSMWPKRAWAYDLLASRIASDHIHISRRPANARG